MGCTKAKITIFRRRAGNINKNLIIPLVVVMVISAITPIAIAGSHSTSIDVTFTPSGDIDIDVSPKTANFSVVTVNTTNNRPQEGNTNDTYTLWNNGSVNAHVYVNSNASTEEGNWDLDSDGVFASTDSFSIEFCNSSGVTAQWVTSVNSSWMDPVPSSDTRKFGIFLDISAASGAAALVQQNTTINITGVLPP